ncbi:MAG: hypothetical protein ACO1OF_12655 [Adhaeribacter sp.]
MPDKHIKPINHRTTAKVQTFFIEKLIFPAHNYFCSLSFRYEQQARTSEENDFK